MDRVLEDEQDNFQTRARQSAKNLRQTYLGCYGERVDDPWNPLNRDALEIRTHEYRLQVSSASQS